MFLIRASLSPDKGRPEIRIPCARPQGRSSILSFIVVIAREITICNNDNNNVMKSNSNERNVAVI